MDENKVTSYGVELGLQGAQVSDPGFLGLGFLILLKPVGRFSRELGLGKVRAWNVLALVNGRDCKF